jgi:hypothetical protein
VPGIHVLAQLLRRLKTWMAGTSPAKGIGKLRGFS